VTRAARVAAAALSDPASAPPVDPALGYRSHHFPLRAIDPPMVRRHGVKLLPAELDADGAYVYRLPSGQVGFHPVNALQYAISAHTEYVTAGGRVWLERAAATARVVAAHREQHGQAWFFPYTQPYDKPSVGYHLDPPWYSAMAQGEALSLFTQMAWEFPDDPLWAQAADGVFESFLVRPDWTGGLTGGPDGPRSAPDGQVGAAGGDQAPAGDGQHWDGQPWAAHVLDGYLWCEEYVGAAAPLQVFNGHVFGLYGLYEYALHTGRAQAAALWAGAATTALHAAPRLRVPGDVSLYCLNDQYCVRPHWASPNYQAIHVRQLGQLSLMTGDRRFAALAEALEGDYVKQ
jgi:hypothetical protein